MGSEAIIRRIRTSFPINEALKYTAQFPLSIVFLISLKILDNSVLSFRSYLPSSLYIYYIFRVHTVIHTKCSSPRLPMASAFLLVSHQQLPALSFADRHQVLKTSSIGVRTAVVSCMHTMLSTNSETNTGIGTIENNDLYVILKHRYLYQAYLTIHQDRHTVPQPPGLISSSSHSSTNGDREILLWVAQSANPFVLPFVVP